MINTIFFGSSFYCIPLLKSLHEHFNLKLIVTQPDKPVGRKGIVTQSAPKQFAVENDISTITPTSLTDSRQQDHVIETIVHAHPTIAVVADYGHLIPKKIFQIPAYQTLNIHFSKLPKYPGASPVQHAILNGDTKINVAFFLMEETLDTGPIIFEKEFPLKGTETTPDLYKKLFTEAAKLLPTVIPSYLKGEIKPTPQSPKSTHKSITPRITRHDGYIPWDFLKAVLKNEKPSDQSIKKLSPLLRNSIKSPVILRSKTTKNLKKNNSLLPTYYSLLEKAQRAFSPWPGIYTEVKISGKTRRLKILKVVPPQMCAQRSSDGGTTQEKTLSIETVQLSGKQPVSWKQFLAGYPEIAKDIQ